MHSADNPTKKAWLALSLVVVVVVVVVEVVVVAVVSFHTMTYSEEYKFI